ncbi:MAG: VanW family protein [Oscillospiraceae bacterium]
MDETQLPVEAEPRKLPRNKKIALIVVGAVLAALLIGYLALCFAASNSTTYFPRSTFTFTGLQQKDGDGGRLNLSGMTPEAAENAIRALGETWYGEEELPLRYGAKTYSFSGKGIAMDSPIQAAQRMYDFQHGNGFLKSGAGYLRSVFAGSSTGVTNPPLSEDGKGALDQILRNLDGKVETPVTETTWAVTDDSLVLQKGAPGLGIDRTMLEQDISVRFFISDFEELTIVPVMTQPQPADLAAIAADILVKPADATLDPKTYEIIPHVTGISVDSAQLKADFDKTAEGGECTVPLTKTEPKITTETLRTTLFRDLLAETSSRTDGDYNRTHNIRLSAKACNGKILLPGEVFAYNDVTGSRTTAAGYLTGIAYIGGKSVASTGGGVCQTASTLYYATLLANLKIVERHNHMFAVDYLPDGMDATVYYGSIDFRFQNNTNSPIKLEVTMPEDGSKVTVRIYGQKQNGNYVKTENRRLYTTYPGVVYKPDPAVPLGTTKVEQTAYIGRKVEAYRCLYDADDKLISRTLESIDTYRARDRILLFNPADAASLGRDPVTGLEVLAPAVPSPAPSPVPTPPEGLPSPEVTPPLPTDAPAPTEAPTESPLPTDAPSPSLSPEVTPTPTPTPTT